MDNIFNAKYDKSSKQQPINNQTNFGKTSDKIEAEKENKNIVINKKNKTTKIKRKNILKKANKPVMKITKAENVVNLIPNIKKKKNKNKQKLNNKKVFAKPKFVVPIAKNQFDNTEKILNRVENDGKYEQFCKNNFR